MRFLSATLIILFLTGSLFAQQADGEKVAKGTIKVSVADADTKAPLIGVTMLLFNTTMGAVSDLDGSITLGGVPVGSYVVKFSLLGYESATVTDVIVHSKRITPLTVELRPSVLQSDDVNVKAGFFTPVQETPVSMINFSAEEIRRAPGAGGDVSRIISGLPSVAKANDERNSLIVRGGSPSENSFYIDNIEIPNINHYPNQGTSAGSLSLFNVDLIRDVNFHTGGFSPIYGDRLSSVMDISFRDGNRDELDGQLDLNFSGIGLIVEGPAGRGSWLLNARRSYLDFIIVDLM